METFIIIEMKKIVYVQAKGQKISLQKMESVQFVKYNFSKYYKKFRVDLRTLKLQDVITLYLEYISCEFANSKYIPFKAPQGFFKTF